MLWHTTSHLTSASQKLTFRLKKEKNECCQGAAKLQCMFTYFSHNFLHVYQQCSIISKLLKDFIKRWLLSNFELRLQNKKARSMLLKFKTHRENKIVILNETYEENSWATAINVWVFNFSSRKHFLKLLVK